jgi:hypothetical protein
MEMVMLFGLSLHHSSAMLLTSTKNLKNPVFDKCAHGDEIQPRKWLDEGE